MNDTEHTSWTSWQPNEVINASDLSRYEGLKAMIDSANTSIAGHNEQIANINTDITSIKSDITSLSSAVTNNTTQLNNIIDYIYPIGSIYFTVDNTNPGARWENTKWVRFAEGRTIMGYSSAIESFNNIETVGGEYEHTLITSELPAHAHTFVPRYMKYSGQGGKRKAKDSGANNTIISISSEDDFFESTNTSIVGENQPFELLSPYITTYIWKRVSLDSIFTVAPGLQYDLTTKIISWNYTAQTSATISFSINGIDYSSEMPTYLYDEESGDVTFYIKGTLSGSNPEIISAALPAKVPETETTTGDNTEITTEDNTEPSTNEGE